MRSGFLKDEHYEALARETAAIGPWFRAMFEVAYRYGWRKGELLTMKVGQVDLFGRTLALRAGGSKNDKARNVPMTDKVFELLQQCVAGKGPDDYVFSRQPGRGRIARNRASGGAQSFSPVGASHSGQPPQLATADWLEELAVYGSARNLRDQELAYQLGLAIENAYLVRLALRQSDKPESS
jgi:integrase